MIFIVRHGDVGSGGSFDSGESLRNTFLFEQDLELLAHGPTQKTKEDWQRTQASGDPGGVDRISTRVKPSASDVVFFVRNDFHDVTREIESGVSGDCVDRVILQFSKCPLYNLKGSHFISWQGGFLHELD